MSAIVYEVEDGSTLGTKRPAVLYWTDQWQADEREALEQLARGEAKRFSTTAEALAWLRQVDD